MASRLTSQRAYTTSSKLLYSSPPRPLSRLTQLLHQTQQQPRKMASTYTANGDNGDSGSTEGELNEWKHRAPYRVHDKQEHFQARYEGSCHCGKVKYQLSREKPLDAKYCHCTTCQKIHGSSFFTNPTPLAPLPLTSPNSLFFHHIQNN